MQLTLWVSKQYGSLFHHAQPSLQILSLYAHVLMSVGNEVAYRPTYRPTSTKQYTASFLKGGIKNNSSIKTINTIILYRELIILYFKLNNIQLLSIGTFCKRRFWVRVKRFHCFSKSNFFLWFSGNNSMLFG